MTVGEENLNYPPVYGLGQCLKHDDGLEPACSVGSTEPDSRPSWCTIEWCYVDKENCAGELITATASSYLAGAYYSYETCNNPNLFV